MTRHSCSARASCLWEEAFRKELLAQMSERIGAEHYGEGRVETAEASAVERSQTQNAAKGDAAKVALVARLPSETTMTVRWTAERLGMGTRGYLNHLLYRECKGQGVSVIKNLRPNG
jgi:hypothetical protein